MKTPNLLSFRIVADKPTGLFLVIALQMNRWPKISQDVEVGTFQSYEDAAHFVAASA